MDIAWSQVIVNLLAAGGGAAIAGYFGVRFGLVRARKERAFDRRLQWYERIVERSHLAWVELTNVWMVIRRDLQPTKDAARALDAAEVALQEAMGQVRMFGTEEDFQQVERTLERLRKGSFSAEGVGAQIAAVVELRQVLSRSARQHLGLSALKGGHEPAEDRGP